MLFAKEILPRAQRACTFDISADRNVWLQPALRSFAIVCDYMETALFAIVCDLRFAIGDSLRSSAIIWKPALTPQTWLFHVVALLTTAKKWTKMKNARAGRAKLLCKAIVFAH